VLLGAGPDPSGRAAAQGPITISLIDVAGDLSSTRVILENYQQGNPGTVKVVFRLDGRK
jgi:hypothetical protein